MLTLSGISRFNPYFMTDNEILLLNTGREKELAFAVDLVEKNIQRKESLQHLLFHGPRGIGKSFFLRLLQITLNEKKGVKMILLPEEQMNIYQPSDLLRVIKNRLIKKDESENMGTWFVESRAEWNMEVTELKEEIENIGIHLVVGMENFDLFFAKSGAFSSKENQFLLRQYLTSQTYITVIASTLYPEIDSQYEQALFHSFAKYELTPWQEIQHEHYLRKRAENEKADVKDISIAQLKSLTHFTGGLPRITAIMVDILQKEHFISTTTALAETIDTLTPFYQDLLERIPHKSRLLFDALIRGGEPCSQSDLAKRVGTSQNVISQHFKWLQVHNYIRVEIPTGEKKRLYSVRDRLFSHYYKMRYILAERGKSKLNIIAEFLTEFYSSKDLLEKADMFCSEGKRAEGRDMYEIILEKAGIAAEQLKWRDDLVALAHAAKSITNSDFEIPETYEDAREMLSRMRDMVINCKNLPEGVKGEDVVEVILSMPTLFFVKIGIIKDIINSKSIAEELIGFVETRNLIKSAVSFGETINMMYEDTLIIEYIDINWLKKRKSNIDDIGFLIHIIAYNIRQCQSNVMHLHVSITIKKLYQSLHAIYIFLLKYKKRSDRISIFLFCFSFVLSLLKKNDFDINYFSIISHFDEKELFELYKDIATAIIRSICYITDYSISYKTSIVFFRLITLYPNHYKPDVSLHQFFVTLLNADKNISPRKLALIKDLLAEAKNIFAPDITAYLEPFEKTCFYLESGKDKTILQKMDPELRVAVEAILKEIQ